MNSQKRLNVWGYLRIHTPILLAHEKALLEFAGLCISLG